MDLTSVTLAERPELLDTFWDMETSWPELMKHGTATYVEPNVWVRHRTGA